jgi:eukaryotic-like serine/threonine-protein kinase
MSASALNHPSRELLSAFGRGSVEDEELRTIQEHLECCEECCQVLESDLTTEPLLEGLRRAAAEVRTEDVYERSQGTRATPQVDDTAVVAASEIQPRRLHLPGYQVLDEVGRGGIGIVYRARHLRLNRLVALKMLLSGNHASAAELARFRVEAETIARLQHPNIVQIHEVGAFEGLPYIALEYLDGGTLDARLKQTDASPADSRAIASFAQTLAQAVQYAHDRGVIHRDLKPANVLLQKVDSSKTPVFAADYRLLTTDYAPKISDFGMAKWLADSHSLTRTGAIAGTPSYMAPEQARGNQEAIGPAVDVYGLGAILYQLLTGRPPFEAASPLETIRQVCELTPEKPSAVGRSVPRDLETICLKCLEKAPGDRYASAGALAEDLGRFLDGRAILARPVGSLERAWQWCNRNSLLASLMASVLVALLCGIAVSSFFALDASGEAATARQEQARAEMMAHRARAHAYGSDMLTAQRAWEDNLTSQFDDLLDRQRPANTDNVDVRGFEWHYWRRRAAESSNSTIVGRHAAAVNKTCFSPDGKRLASASSDGTVKVWAVGANKELLSFDKHKGSVLCVCFSPNGKWIASAGLDHLVLIWDADSATVILTLQGHKEAIDSLAFSSDGKQLATASVDGTVKLWDVGTGQEKLSLVGHTENVNCVCFSPDGLSLATASTDQSVRLWDSLTGQEKRALRGHATQVTGVCFSPDGKRLASCGARSVCIWSPETGAALLSFPVSTSGANSVRFSPNGDFLATASSDQSLTVWDAGSGQPFLTLRGHSAQVVNACFSPDGNCLASVGNDRTVRTWDLSAAMQRLRWSGHQSQVSSLATSPNGRWLASAGGDWDGGAYRYVRGELVLWNTDSGAAPPRSMRQADGVTCVAFSPDGNWLACGSGDWDETKGRYRSGQVQLWDAERWSKRDTLPGHSGAVLALAFSPDSQWLASGGMNGDVLVRRLPGGEVSRVLPGLTKAVTTIAISPDGRHLAAGSFDALVKLWDLSRETPIATFPALAGASCVAFSPDGTQLAVASYTNDCVIYDVASCQEIRRLRGHLGSVTHVAFSPNGQRLVTSSEDWTVRVWDAASGQQTLVLRGHSDVVRSVTFSRDGNRLFSGGWDHSIRIWDATPLDHDH